MLVKVCGMREHSNINDIAGLKPDFMGFIFYMGSRRYVGADFNPGFLPAGMQNIAVFVNESFEKVLSVTRKFGITHVQLHGTESPAYCQMLQQSGISVWKAFGLHENFHWEVIPDYAPFCSYFLFDTSSKNHGGTGTKFDWKLLSNRTFGKPFFLSGGIGPEDASELKNIDHPELAGIDINSRFETEPGLKDKMLIKNFLKELKR